MLWVKHLRESNVIPTWQSSARSFLCDHVLEYVCSATFLIYTQSKATVRQRSLFNLSPQPHPKKQLTQNTKISEGKLSATIIIRQSIPRSQDVFVYHGMVVGPDVTFSRIFHSQAHSHSGSICGNLTQQVSLTKSQSHNYCENIFTCAYVYFRIGDC